MATMPNALGMQMPVGNTALTGGATGSGGMVPSTLPTNVGGTISQTPTTMAQNNVYAAPQATNTNVGSVDGGVPTGQPQTGAVPGMPVNTTQGSSGINWTNGANTVTGDFGATYGSGTGTAITDVLSSLGTTNNAAIQAMINQTNTAANQQYGNIQAQEAAAGVTPNSSTAALASGDFYSQVNQGLQTNIAQMEQQQQNTLLQTLLGEGAAHGGDTSFMGTLNNMATNFSNDVGAIVGGAKAGG